MAEEKKIDFMVDSVGEIEKLGVVKKKSKKQSVDSEAEDDVKKKNKEKRDEDGVKRKSKKQSIDSEAEDDVKKKIKEKRSADGVKKKSKKNIEGISADSEAEDDGKKTKSKKESGDEKPLDDANRKTGKRKREEIDLGAQENAMNEMKKNSKKKKLSVESEVEEASFNSTQDAKKKNKKTKQSVDSQVEDAKKKSSEKKPSEGAEVEETSFNSTKDAKKKKKTKQSVDSEVEDDNLNSTKDAKKKSNEMKPSEDSEVEETSFNSTKDAKKKRKKKAKQSVDSEVEDDNLNSTKDAKEKSNEKKPNEDSEAEKNTLSSAIDAKKKKKEYKQSEGSEAEENCLNSTKDAKKTRKKKKKQTEVSEAEENNNDGKDAKKKRQKQESVTTPSSKSSKRVKFSDQVEIFPTEDEKTEEEEEDEDEEEKDEVVRGKRFTKEEDELVKQAVLEYVDNHALGDEGVNMVMECQSHKQVKGCWKEIAYSLPWRTRSSVYHRAHTIFQGGSKGEWTKEDLELVKEFQAKHGNNWKRLADAMGKHRIHVKDAWRRTRLNMNRGHWSREEYQTLFDLVNKDLRMKAFQEKHSKYGMLRDNIPWMAISDEVGTRDHVTCCNKWYDQLLSPMVVKGIWANVDDYRLLEELLKLDAACIDDVEWDNLLENRDGEACRKRWNQMVRHIGLPSSKTFAEQVEILSDRYCPDLAQDREDFDNRPYDPDRPYDPED